MPHPAQLRGLDVSVDAAIFDASGPHELSDEEILERLKAKEKRQWPKELRDQVAAIRDRLPSDSRAARSWTAEEIAHHFRRSRRPQVASVLETLSSLGILITFDAPTGHWRMA